MNDILNFKNKLDEKLYKYLDKEDSINIKSLVTETENVIKRPKAKKKYKLIDFINKFVTNEGMIVNIYHDDILNKSVYDLNSHAYRLIILYEDNGIHALVSRINEQEIFDINGETYEKVLDNLLNVFVKEVFAPLRTDCSSNWCYLLNKYDKHYKY